MNIGVLGSGQVGQVLARAFAARGHRVTIGSRDPAKLEAFVRETGEGVRAGSFGEAARFGEVVVLATLFSGTKGAIDLAGPVNFQGKIVIDATNPLLFEDGKPPELSLGWRNSAGEEIARWLPGARVVKALNTIGNQHMVDPTFSEGVPTMFIAGDDAVAKKTVTGLIESLGWKDQVVDLGGIEESRLLEPLAMIWIHYGIRAGTWNHAFKLLLK